MKRDNEKEYTLKPIEVNLLTAIQQSHQAQMSNVVSFIALERIAYKVTEQTQFRVEGDKLYIHEAEATTDSSEEVSVS